MKIVELIKISTETLKMMSNSGIRTDDWKHIQMFEEFQAMRLNKDKFRYIMAFLSEKYKISESSVKRIVKRLSSEVMF